MIDFMLEEIARLFGYPCDNGLDGTMHGNNVEWCENNCNKVSAKECWRKYFENKKENNDEK